MKKTIIKFKNVFLKFKEIIISVLLLLIVPCMCSYFLEYTFINHSVKNIPTVIVDHDNSSLSKNIVKQIKTNETFNVTNYSNNDEDIKKLITNGEVVTGIIIPERFSKDAFDGKSPKVMVFYDGTEMLAASTAKTKMAEIFGTIRAGYLINVEEGKLGILPKQSTNNAMPIKTDNIIVGNPEKSVANFLIQGMVIGICQVGMIIIGAIIIKENDKYIWMLIKGIGFGIIGALSIFLALIIEFKYFAMPYRGSIIASVPLTILFSIIIVNLGIIFRLILKDKLSAASNAGLIIQAAVLMTGYTFPLMSMPDIMKIVSKAFPFFYYGFPMRDLSLLGLSFNDVLPQIYCLVNYLILTWIVMLIICIFKKVFKKDYNLKNKILNKFVHRGNGIESSKIHS